MEEEATTQWESLKDRKGRYHNREDFSLNWDFTWKVYDCEELVREFNHRE